VDGPDPSRPLSETRSPSAPGPTNESGPPFPVFSTSRADLPHDTSVGVGHGGVVESTPRFPDPRGPFPQDFGRYRLLELLGGGGMGTVYRALDLTLENTVALKVPHPKYAADPRHMERFRREARYAARLVHPGLAWATDLGEIDGTPYFVRRYVEGKPLSECAALGDRECVAIVRDVAIAMAAAHREGVVHRDLKPLNIILTPEGIPVVIDFGLAIRPGSDDTRLTSTNVRPGTLQFMAPEQIHGDPRDLGPKCDIYSLGRVLKTLLERGRLVLSTPQVSVSGDPDTGPTASDAIPPPRSEIDPALVAIYNRACANLPDDRFADMAAFAAELDTYLERDARAAAAHRPYHGPARPFRGISPLVRRDVIRFVFAGPGSSAPKDGPAPDRLFLDVGNDLRRGVIDHHHLQSYGGSTTRLVIANPDLVAGSVQARRDPDAPFTIVLHESPDFDSVASAYLAIALLTTGEFPTGTEALARYADKIDEGSIGHTLSQPFGPYTAYMQLLHRHARLGLPADHSYWRECIRQGLDLIAYVLDRGLHDGVALPSVDAFACPGLFDEDDRQDVLADIERYHRKLADPATGARIVRLSLPGQFGGRVIVDTLMVRDVQNEHDRERCNFFKDWARSDRERSPDGEGFLGLSVFMSESPRDPRRCILSVTPDSGASLRGLAALLDEAESKHRRQIYGEDDRLIDPATGSRKPPRAGYDNADPWYDGRAHGFTIVDSPRSGTLLAAEEIEGIFVKFGGLSVSG
jgi:serine/threonine protein kinase